MIVIYFVLKPFLVKKKKKKKVISGAPRAARSNPNASQGFIWNEITWPPGLLEKKTTTKSCLFGVIFYVYTNVDNRERARASY